MVGQKALKMNDFRSLTVQGYIPNII